MAATNVNSVTLKSRCDANGWGHTQFTVVVRYNQVIRNTSFYIHFTFINILYPCIRLINDGIFYSRAGTTPVIAPATNTGASLLTQNTLCGSFTGRVAQCSDLKINCASQISSATALTVQLYTNGRNVHLMFEDITVGTAASGSGNHLLSFQLLTRRVKCLGLFTIAKK